MKILITGSTGFVGTTLIPYLYYNGKKDLCLLVRNIDKAKVKFGNLNIPFISTQDADWDNQVIDYSADIVIHLAAYFTGRHDKDNIHKLIVSNIEFTSLLLEAISKTNCTHFINIGTFSEFRNGDGVYMPNNFYSATKTAERPIIKYYQSISKWNWINVVVYSPYGRHNEYKKVIDYMIDAIGSGKPVSFTKGEQQLDFIHVDDIADFFLTLINKINSLCDSYYQFYLGTGTSHSLKDVGRLIEKIGDKPINGLWGAREYSDQDIMHATAPIEKNISILGWKPKISLSEGITILLKDERIIP